MDYKDIDRVNSEIEMIDMKGKSYAMVSERVTAFRKIWPDGFIRTEIVSISPDGKVVIMKAKAGFYREDGTEMILATGLAREVQGQGMVNGTSHIENCVPIDTEILTADGWKYYYQIKPGDQVYSMNIETEKVELCGVTGINVYKDKPIVEMKTSRFKARCTYQHKWIVRGQYEMLHKEATENLKVSQKIVQNVEQQYTPSNLGKMLGWLMCDCTIKRTENGMPSNAEIKQAKHVREIEALFGKGVKDSMPDETWKQCYTWYVPADSVRATLGLFGISTYADLKTAMLKADINDVAGCYQSMMMADGESRGFSSTYYDLVEAVQIMCVRLGIATGHIKSRMMRNSTKPIYTLSIKKTDGAWFSEMEVNNLPPQDVWCPTTENGTWFMRQGDFVTLTSNCETGAVGRCLGMIGLGLNGGGICSAEELVNAVVGQKQIEAETKKEAKAANAGNKPFEKDVLTADKIPF